MACKYVYKYGWITLYIYIYIYIYIIYMSAHLLKLRHPLPPETWPMFLCMISHTHYLSVTSRARGVIRTCPSTHPYTRTRTCTRTRTRTRTHTHTHTHTNIHTHMCMFVCDPVPCRWTPSCRDSERSHVATASHEPQQRSCVSLPT